MLSTDDEIRIKEILEPCNDTEYILDNMRKPTFLQLPIKAVHYKASCHETPNQKLFCIVIVQLLTGAASLQCHKRARKTTEIENSCLGD